MAGLEATCGQPIPRNGLRFWGQVNPAPLRDMLKSAGVDVLSIDIRVPLNGTARCDPAPGEKIDSQTARECTYVLKGPPRDSPIIRFSFGYDTPVLVRIATILGFLLLLPIGLTLWIRRRALNAPAEAKAEVFFAYFKSLRWGFIGGVLIWWTAIDLLHADDLVAYLHPAANLNDVGLTMTLPWVLLWLPPAVVYFICLVLSSPIQVLRGTKQTQRQMLSQAFWSVARLLIPLSLLLFAIGAPRTRTPPSKVNRTRS